MNLSVECKVEITEGEAGLVFYMTPEQHYEIALRRTDKGVELFRRLCIGDIRHEDHVIALPQGESSAMLCCNASNFTYNFSAKTHSADSMLVRGKFKAVFIEFIEGHIGILHKAPLTSDFGILKSVFLPKLLPDIPEFVSFDFLSE